MKRLLTAFGIATLLIWGALAYAQEETTTPTEPPQITFPIEELGGCESKQACKLYCDQAANRDACFAYAQKVGLMSKEKVNAAKMILTKKGPGGCTSRDSCKAYCDDSAHQEECLTFATQHKILTSEKVELIRSVVKGEAPGACKSAETCRMYCQDPAHKEECRAFAEQNGLKKPFASSTPPGKMIREIVASSTDAARELKMRNASGTQLQKNMPPRPELKKPNASSSLDAKMRPMGSTTKPKMPPPPKPQNAEPKPENSDLGAAVFRAFAQLLGF